MSANSSQNAPHEWQDACQSLAQTCATVSASLASLQSDLQIEQRDPEPAVKPAELAPSLPRKSMDALQECVNHIADLAGTSEGMMGKTGSYPLHRNAQGGPDQAPLLFRQLDETVSTLEALVAAASTLPGPAAIHEPPAPLPASGGLDQAEALERLVDTLADDVATACDQLAASPGTTLSEVEQQNADLAARIAEQDAQLQSLKEEAEHSTHLLESAQSELRRAEDDRLAHKGRQAELLKQAEKIRQLEQELSSRLSAHGATGDRAAKSAAADLENRISSLESELAVSRAYVNNTTRKLKALQEANTTLREELINRPVASEPTSSPETAPLPEPLSNDWFLQVEESQVYGPVEARVLQEWAADCRVGPDHLVSRDQETWVQAGELPFLQMDWYVTLPDETTFGPLNLFAIQHLVSDGSVRADSSATHKSQSRTVSLEELLSPELSRLAGTQADLALRVDRLQAELDSARQQIAAPRRSASDAGTPSATPAAQPPKFTQKKRSR